ncbi:MAG: MDR family MFS transporter [Promethearchaeota archaeon]|jgi:MFS family permease
MFTKIRSTYKEYPKEFKVLVMATFIDRLGAFILFPFYSLYITSHFGVGMVEVGILISIFSIGNIIGGTLGGALADKYGRRAMILLGLVVSGISNVLMGLINDLYLFYIVGSISGLVGNFGGPARQAMIADILPKEKRAEGFGILRVALNLSAVVGPLLGGFVATQSYLLLFIIDAVSSAITAIIVYLVIPETKPQKLDHEPEETIVQTLKGYKEVLKDWVFVLFLLTSAIIVLVYMQMNSTLSVFLRDVHGFPEQGFGWLLSMNAIMVVFLQFWISKRISKYPPMKVMAFGALFLMVGFSMYGFISEVPLFFIAMAIITVGEMIWFPVGQVAVASFAPEDKRGRYMAIFQFQWAIPNLFGILAAGLVMESIGPNWVWYFAGILSIISIIGFLLLQRVTQKRFTEEIIAVDEVLVEI